LGTGHKALREAVVNAVAHRDYAIPGSRVMVDVFDDRVEITSPGALPNHKTAESVLAGGPPRSRNESMRAFNGTEPELVNHKAESWVRVTLRRS
jgi:predicted HTH transcriptional regulator